MSVVTKSPTKTKVPTKTISLRLPLEYDNYLEIKSKQTGRSVSNYIKFLIKQARDQEWNQMLEKSRIIGKQAFADHGLDIGKMTEEDAYNFFKSI